MCFYQNEKYVRRHCKPRQEERRNIYANSEEYNYENFGDFDNYVMQSDVLMQTLTARETL